MESFKEYKSKKDSITEGSMESDITYRSLKDMLSTDRFVIFPTEDNLDTTTPWIVGNDQPEYKMIQNVIKARIRRIDSGTNESTDAPLFTEYLSSKNKGIYYLTEEENQIVDEAVIVFENEYEGDINKVDEGFLGKLVGGAAGFLAGPMIGRVIARALGIEKGILYDMLTSRLVSTALGAAIGKAWTDKK